MAPPPRDTDLRPGTTCTALERHYGKRTRACPIQSTVLVSTAVMMLLLPSCESESLRGRDGPLNGGGLLWEGRQTYFLFNPGSAGPENPRALKGSRGRPCITGGNKTLGHVAPRFASLDFKLCQTMMLAVRPVSAPRDGRAYPGALSCVNGRVTDFQVLRE